MITNEILTKIQNVGKNELEMGFDRTIKPYIISKIKYHFGKEFILSSNTFLSYNNDIVEFFKKYDNNFDKHVTFKEGKMDDVNAYITLIPYDSHTFIYVATKQFVPVTNKNIILNKSDDENNKFNDIYIYIFGKHMNKISNLFQKCIDNVFDSKDKGDSLYVVNSYNGSDSRGSDITYYDISNQHRSEDTVFFSYDELNRITTHIDNFLSNKPFYDEHKLLFKTGILLYGEPGTGKSTLANIIATKYHRSIVSIDMSNISNINLTEVAGLITRDKYDNYVVLLEDIDTAFNSLDRKDEDGNDKTDTDKDTKKIINRLLQFLDSNTSPTNVIFIATTNYIDKLDNAITRSGRFDLKIEVKGLKEKDAFKMGKAFNLNEDQIKNAISKYKKDHKDKDLVNQSDIQNYFLEEMKDNAKDI